MKDLQFSRTGMFLGFVRVVTTNLHFQGDESLEFKSKKLSRSFGISSPGLEFPGFVLGMDSTLITG